LPLPLSSSSPQPGEICRPSPELPHGRASLRADSSKRGRAPPGTDSAGCGRAPATGGLRRARAPSRASSGHGREPCRRLCSSTGREERRRGEKGAEPLHPSKFNRRSLPTSGEHIPPGAAPLPPLPIQTAAGSPTKHTVTGALQPNTR
jgi:hypothetical protein